MYTYVFMYFNVIYYICIYNMIYWFQNLLYLGFNGDLLEYKFIVEFDVFLLLKNDLIRPKIFPQFLFKFPFPSSSNSVLLTPIGNNS
jgi:hypothetical protein